MNGFTRAPFIMTRVLVLVLGMRALWLLPPVSQSAEVNLVVNGDFELGNTAFSTDYSYSPGDVTLAETYTVDTNPLNNHPAFSPCGDHTTGTGNMMIVNGAVQPNVIVWSQSVAVSPNQTYELAAWATSVFPDSPAQLQFLINHSPVGELQLSSETCQWQPFTATWISGASTTAVLSIIDLNTDAFGNDFALDDLSLEVSAITETIPPAITVSASPATLWPPNGKLVPVTVSGTITDNEPGGSGVNASSAAYVVADEYGQVQPSGSITLGADGSYTFTISLQASRKGNDQDGRHYLITVSAKDNAGNLGASSTIVTVPHDQGQ